MGNFEGSKKKHKSGIMAAKGDDTIHWFTLKHIKQNNSLTNLIFFKRNIQTSISISLISYTIRMWNYIIE